MFGRVLFFLALHGSLQVNISPFKHFTRFFWAKSNNKAFFGNFIIRNLFLKYVLYILAHKSKYFHRKLSFKKKESGCTRVRFWEINSKPQSFPTDIDVWSTNHLKIDWEKSRLSRSVLKMRCKQRGEFEKKINISASLV